MADTKRTRAQILALIADNVTGQISEQDFRDIIVTIMEAEFVNPGDVWARPNALNTTTDAEARGWRVYSQTVSEACSFMNAMVLGPSGNWLLADVADSTLTGVIGLAMDSYTAGQSVCEILREGLVYNSVFSATWSGNIGRPIYLQSGAPGSISVTITTNSVLLIGFIEHSDGSTIVASGKFRFSPEWAIKGS